MTAGYGTRTSSQTAWLAAAAGLVVILVLGGGWLVWRGTGAAPPRLDPAGQAGTAVPGLSVPTAGLAFGAPHIVDDVPWGFPLTPDGAAAAAATAVAATGQADVVFDPVRFAEVAAVVFTAEQAERQARKVETARSEFELSGWAAQPPSRRLYFFTPLAVRLVTYAPDLPAATVDVWSMSLVGVGDAGGAVFTTSTVTLAADDTGQTWTVTGLDTKQGPTPLVHDPATAPGRTRLWLRDALATWPLPLHGASR